MNPFVHLHVHSQYSLLDGMCKIPDLVAKARALGMNALALTDHGTMCGIKEFYDEVKKMNQAPQDAVKKCEEEIKKAQSEEEKAALQPKLLQLKQQVADYVPFKPIFGVEAYCARRSLEFKDSNVKAVHAETGREYIVDRGGYHLILLAKNKIGYLNLCKMVSKSWMEGYYHRPRIDKKLLEAHHEGLICCTACIAGELPQLLMEGKQQEAEATVGWFKHLFGDDYYIEMQRHQTNRPGGDAGVYVRQCQVNPMLVELARKTHTKLVVTNDVHFIEEEHAEAHDRLICLSTGKKIADEERLHYTKQEWLKSPEQMAAIFPDFPEALVNTSEIADKVEFYSITSDAIMPKFPIPASFGTEEAYRNRYTEQALREEFTRDEHGNEVMTAEEAQKKFQKLGGYDKVCRIKLEADYLAELTWIGAKKRYGEALSEEVQEQIRFELHVMKTMGFPGYFLIVQDYIRAAREELDVSVGPGRGSAAGSVVAYCLGITDVDPLKYHLLFERFLNPDRISLPDIDVDFDDDGRGKVLDWVTRKYGKERVAHIITYGTMATKSSIKDVGRVQDVPLAVVNKIVSYVPDKFPDSLQDPKTHKVPKVNVKNCLRYVPELQQALEGDDPNVASMLRYAKDLEGTVRQTGVHACGVIIGADDLTKFAPLSVAVDKATGQEVVVTQYDGHMVESVGLIKMDFLGLSTLSIIKETLHNIKKSTGDVVDIDHIPIDDEKTYQLYREGKTVGTFQFQSPGMRKYLRELQPTVFEDLIAMNALYRPGPMQFIPQFINRKHGREAVTYDLPAMESILRETYGVTVYQEQVMLLSRVLAGFTRGESDTLRKAMGKKQIETMNKLKAKFLEGGGKHGYSVEVLNKIWGEWQKFAEYAFNKSHATCYSWVAYQTAYLKAHYPVQFMAANLTRNAGDIKKVKVFMEECRVMGIQVLGPDVNESEMNFVSNAEGNIRFGLGAIKGVGASAVEAIVQEREKNGRYKSVFDFFERVDLSACNRKAVESLIYSGAFDGFTEMIREQYFVRNLKDEPFLDVLMRYGANQQGNRSQLSLFGDAEAEVLHPALPKQPEWSLLQRLSIERELIGMYLSVHPLDQYKMLIYTQCNCKAVHLGELPYLLMHYSVGQEIRVAGIITKVETRFTKNNKPYTILTVEDFSGSSQLRLFGQAAQTYDAYAKEKNYVMIYGKLADRFEEFKKPWQQKNQEAEVIKPENLEFKVSKMALLEDVSKTSIERLTVNLSVGQLTDDWVQQMAQYMLRSESEEVARARGEIITDLYVNVVDEENRITAGFRSKGRFRLTTEFMEELNRQCGADEEDEGEEGVQEEAMVLDEGEEYRGEESVQALTVAALHPVLSYAIA